MRIMYVHGIGSGKDGNTVNWIRETFKNHEVISFDIPFDPKEAIKFIKDAPIIDSTPLINSCFFSFFLTISDSESNSIQKKILNI